MLTRVTISWPVFLISEPTVVPVVSLIVPARIGPEKVVVPMSISCRGLSQTLFAPVRDKQIIHNNPKKERGQMNCPQSKPNICSGYAPGEPNTQRGSEKPNE